MKKFMGAHCGHTYEANENQNLLGLCPECRLKVFGVLADLQGTEKQIAWAEDIRLRLLEMFVTLMARRGGNDFANKLPESGLAITRKLASIDSAKFWIEHRDDDANGLIKAVL